MRRLMFLVLLLTAILPVSAAAQTPAATPAPKPAAVDPWAVGEKYWIEFSYTYWAPSLEGNVTSDGLGLVGSRVDLVSDLSLERARFDDFRFVIRPLKKHRFKF